MRAIKTSGTLYRSSLPPFEYFDPRSIDEALTLLGRLTGKARLLAGGTDLLVRMKREADPPLAIVDLKKIPALDYPPRLERASLVISPLTTLEQIAESGLLQKKVPVLPSTASMIASCQVRNRATLGGNLCMGSASADMAPPLITLGARAVVRSRGRTAALPLDDFFKGPGQTAAGREGLLLQIQVPLPRSGERSMVRRHLVRTGMDFPVVSVAVTLLRARSTLEDVRIAAGGAGPVPMRLRKAEAQLRGTRGDEDALARAGEAAAAECRPSSDFRGSADYKTEMLKVHLVRVLREMLS